MAPMTPSEQADAHDRNFVAAISLLADTVPAGSTALFGTVPVAITGVAGSSFNAVWLLVPPDPADLRAALDFVRASDIPFTVHVRSELSDLVAAGPTLGLSDEGRLPCFALENGPIPSPMRDLSIERVELANWKRFLDATIEGFGMPRAMVEALYPAGVLDDPRVRAFVGILEGRPIATSISIRTGTTVGVYSVATAPTVRGRGIGTAMTWHVLADADPGWEVAVLQASEMGQPVYERMGFKLVREFTELVGPSQE
jgi:GNAT superfamily N-acetyltransferase